MNDRAGRAQIWLRWLAVALTACAALLVGSCSLFGPRPGRITDWLDLPEPGSVYTYRTTSVWHDGSESEEERSYLVERVEEITDGILVKLTATDRIDAFYWIINTAAGELYQSNDAVIDDADLLLLVEPVEEDAEWEFGQTDYEVDRTGLTVTTDAGVARHTATVEIRFPREDELSFSRVEGEVRWSPTFGLISYTESYDSGYYISELVQELISVTQP